MQPLAHLIYTSTIAQSLDAATLKQLVSAARRNNAALGVTSVLVQSGLEFLQAIEGTPDIVEGLHSRIARDPRHANVTTLVVEPAEHRLFADWALGFTSLTPQQVASLSGAQAAGIEQISLLDLTVGRAKRMLASIASSASRQSQPKPFAMTPSMAAASPR